MRKITSFGIVIFKGSKITSVPDIQFLIAAIDGILPQTSASPSGLTPGDLAQFGLVLQQVRSYLASTEPQVPTSEQQEVAAQITLLVAQEIDSLRVNLTQPLQAELEGLRQRRESLITEISELETAKQQYQSLAQQQAKQQQLITDFLQVLLPSLQESLTQQVEQTLKNLEAQFLSFELSISAHYSPLGRQNWAGTASPMLQGNTDEMAPSSSLGEIHSDFYPPYTPLHPVERLEQMRQLQAKSDQILTTLDSTLQVVFETLQRNIQSYQESLSQKLEKMYNLGQESQVTFTALVQQITENFRNSTLQLTTLRELLPLEASSVASPVPKRAAIEQNMPFPGMEISPTKMAIPPVMIESSEEAIETITKLTDLFPAEETPTASPQTNLNVARQSPPS